MAARTFVAEAIALTDKKLSMSLDDIIEMNKKSNAKANRQRPLNKSQTPFNTATGNGNSSKVRRFMDSRSSVRQGALAQRRSNFQGKQFPIATEATRKAATAPLRNRPLNHNWMTNWNKSRVGVPAVQRRADVAYSGKRQQAKMVPKQRPQTLDSLFANMKEQRIRAQQNVARRAGAGAVGFQPRQRGRGQFGNFTN